MTSRVEPWSYKPPRASATVSDAQRRRDNSKVQAISTIHSAKEVLNRYEQNELYAILKPYLQYMQLFGLHFDDWNSEITTSVSGLANRQRGQFNYQKWYCVFTVFVNWALFLNYLVLAIIFFRDMERMKFDEIPIMVSVLAWHLQNACNAIICYRLSSNYRLYRTFFDKWRTFDPPEHLKPELHSYFKKVTRIALANCILFHVPNSIAWIVGSFDFLPSHSDFRLFPVDRYFGKTAHNALHRVWGVTASFTTPAYVVPLWLFYLISSFLKTVYDRYNVEFNANVSVAPVSVGSQVELYRRRYERLHQLFQGAEYNLSAYLLYCVLTNMCILCSITYRAICFCSRGVMKVVEVYWCIISVMKVSVVSYVGAMVSQSAHSALCDLNTVPSEHLSYENRQLVSLFSYRLSGPLIAYTAGGFFYITKNFIITLISSFISYFFLLVGFGSSNSTCEYYTAVPDEDELFRLSTADLQFL